MRICRIQEDDSGGRLTARRPFDGGDLYASSREQSRVVPSQGGLIDFPGNRMASQVPAGKPAPKSSSPKERGVGEWRKTSPTSISLAWGAPMPRVQGGQWGTLEAGGIFGIVVGSKGRIRRCPLPLGRRQGVDKTAMRGKPRHKSQGGATDVYVGFPKPPREGRRVGSLESSQDPFRIEAESGRVPGPYAALTGGQMPSPARHWPISGAAEGSLRLAKSRVARCAAGFAGPPFQSQWMWQSHVTVPPPTWDGSWSNPAGAMADYSGMAPSTMPKGPKPRGPAISVVDMGEEGRRLE